MHSGNDSLVGAAISFPVDVFTVPRSVSTEQLGQVAAALLELHNVAKPSP